jgi:hypothetical protein
MRQNISAREIEVDEAGEVGEASQHELVEAIPGEVEVAQRGEGADAGGGGGGAGGLSRQGSNRVGGHLKTGVGATPRMGAVAWMGRHHAR